jgi:hypothetical protein
MGRVAQLGKTSRQRLSYLIEKGKVPGPSLQVPGRRLFTERDVQEILKRLEEEPELRGAAQNPSPSTGCRR